MNLLVEDWGGKIQSHDVSAKEGTGITELLEKVMLEAELLELKANPSKAAQGTVVEAFLDKGRIRFNHTRTSRYIAHWRLYFGRSAQWQGTCDAR